MTTTTNYLSTAQQAALLEEQDYNDSGEAQEYYSYVEPYELHTLFAGDCNDIACKALQDDLQFIGLEDAKVVHKYGMMRVTTSNSTVEINSADSSLDEVLEELEY